MHMFDSVISEWAACLLALVHIMLHWVFNRRSFLAKLCSFKDYWLMQVKTFCLSFSECGINTFVWLFCYLYCLFVSDISLHLHLWKEFQVGGLVPYGILLGGIIGYILCLLFLISVEYDHHLLGIFLETSLFYRTSMLSVWFAASESITC